MWRRRTSRICAFTICAAPSVAGKRPLELSVIGRTLQHQNVSTTAIYARLNLDSVREAMQKATSAMLVAGGIGHAAEVKPILGTKKKAARS